MVPDLYRGKQGLDAEEASHVSGDTLFSYLLSVHHEPLRWTVIDLTYRASITSTNASPDSVVVTLSPTTIALSQHHEIRETHARCGTCLNTCAMHAQLADSLDFGRAVDDIKEVVEWLRSGGAQKVGITGFCQGGALTCLAAENAPVDCAVAFYGYPKSSPSKVSSLTAHVAPMQRSDALWHTTMSGLTAEGLYFSADVEECLPCQADCMLADLCELACSGLLPVIGSNS